MACYGSEMVSGCRKWGTLVALIAVSVLVPLLLFLGFCYLVCLYLGYVLAASV